MYRLDKDFFSPALAYWQNFNLPLLTNISNWLKCLSREQKIWEAVTEQSKQPEKKQIWEIILVWAFTLSWARYTPRFNRCKSCICVKFPLVYSFKQSIQSWRIFTSSVNEPIELDVFLLLFSKNIRASILVVSVMISNEAPTKSSNVRSGTSEPCST